MEASYTFHIFSAIYFACCILNHITLNNLKLKREILKSLPFFTFVSCFGNSRKVDICSEIPDMLFAGTSGKRIPVSSILVWLIVSSIKKKNEIINRSKFPAEKKS